jgi:transposase InsO family protein
LGKTSLQGLLQKHLVIPQLATLTQLASKDCLCCAQHNPGQGPKPPLLIQKKGVYPFQHLEIDFTEIQPSKTYQYLLVVVCTFTGWMEAYPTRTEKATEVSRALAKEIIPQVRVPSSIGSDNGPAFVSQVVKGISRAVGLTWDLHTQYHPQSSGQVERMNRTIKTALAKQCQETGLPSQMHCPWPCSRSDARPGNAASPPLKSYMDSHHH